MCLLGPSCALWHLQRKICPHPQGVPFALKVPEEKHCYMYLSVTRGLYHKKNHAENVVGFHKVSVKYKTISYSADEDL